MAVTKALEARLILSGEDKGASAAVEKVVAAVRKMDEAAKVSDRMRGVAEALQRVARESQATEAAMKARAGFAAAEAGLKATQTAAVAAAKALADAKVARAAYEGVKAAAGSEQARQIEAATRAVRDAGAAYRRIEGDVRKATAAVAAQTSTMASADAAALKLGADLGNLERHQAGLATKTDLATRALRAQIAAEDAGAKATAARAQRSANRKEAATTVVAGAGVLAAHEGKKIGLEAIDKAASFDYAKRYQVVAGGVSEEAQKRVLLSQALRIGQETKFTNEDIVEAQTATLQGLPMKGDLKATVAAAIVENVKNYAVMMRAPMEQSAQGIRSFLQTSQKDISTEEKAVFEAKRASNLLVKMAKLGGMKDNDVQDFLTYGVPTGTAAGLSDTTLAALGAAGKRSGLGGAETGVFVRAAASKLVAPTQKGLDALTAAGIDYNKYTKMPEAGLNVKNLESLSRRRFGKDFTEDQRNRLRDLLEDGEIVGNKDEFTKQVSEIVQEGFGKTKGGKTKAQDASKVAKMVGDFHKLSTENVNSEALLDEILSNPKMTIALRNAFFTDKHGGKASVLSSQYDQFGKDREELKHLQDKDPDFAANAAKYMAGGLGGAIDNLKGSYETLVLNVGEANSGLVKFAAEGLASGTDMFSNLSRTSQQVISLVGGGAATAGGIYGTAKIAGKLLGFGGGLNGSAAALTKSAGLLDAAAIKLAGGVVPEVVKNAAPAAGVALGVGGAAVATGAVVGAVLNENATVNAQGAMKAITGEETDGDRLARINREMLERQKTLAGQAEELTQRLETERGVYDRLKAAKEGGSAVDGPLADAGARIKRWEEELTALDAKLRELSSTPIPPPRPDMFKPITDKAAEAGAQAGQSIADGVKEKAPEVEEQGKTLYQRLKDLFAEGIKIPISFAPGEGGGAGVQTAGFGGGGGLGGLIHRASVGGGGGFTGGGGDGTGRTVPRGAFGPGTGAGDSWHEAVMRAEGTAGKDPYNVVLGNGRYGLPSKPLTDMTLAEAYRFGRTVRARHGSSSAIGAFQIVGQTMKTFMGEAGLGWDDKFSPENQRKLADVIRRRQGFGAWEGFKSHPGELGNARRLRPYTTLPNEPRLVKGLDGKEGLDLGNGTMKMPDGSIRSITKTGLEIPEAPSGGFGGGGRGGIHAAAERMHAAAEKLENANWHGQMDVRLLGGGGRVTGMRAKGRGMSADMGVSMPGAKESDDDWV